MGRRSEILLIGASGRVGRLVRAAWRMAPLQEFDVTAQYRRPVPWAAHGDVIWDPVADPVLPLKRNDRTTMVVLAGATPGSNVPLHRNTDIAIGCLEAARKLGIERILIASSSAAYGAGSGESFKESDAPLRVSDYGNSKLEMEAAVRDAGADLDVCCLRIGNVLGADALLLAAANASRDEPLLLDRFASGGGPVRSYIDPQTLAAVLASLSRHIDRLPKVLNVAAPQPIAMQALTELTHTPWRWREAPDGAIETIILDCTALGSMYPFGADDSDPVCMLERLNEVKIAL